MLNSRSRSPRTRAWGGALILLALAAGLLALPGHAAAAPAAQAGTATISGQVISLDNVPLPNVHLAAYNQPQDVANRQPLVEFQSDAQGQYSVQVPAGQIWMVFLTQDVLGQSFWGYSNKPQTVTAGQTLTGQDFIVAIRVVAAGAPTPVPPVVPPPIVPPPAPPVGMPATGSPDLLPGLLAALALLCLGTGVATRRLVRR